MCAKFLWASSKLKQACHPLLVVAAPFQAETTVKLYEKIRDTEVLYPETRPISASLRSLLEGLLCKDPEQRMDIPAVMAHEWFNQVGDASLQICVYCEGVMFVSCRHLHHHKAASCSCYARAMT